MPSRCQFRVLKTIIGVKKGKIEKFYMALQKNDFVEIEYDAFDKDFNKLVEKSSADYIGMTVYTGNHLQTFEYFDKLKSKNKHVKTILGGPHATFFPEESSKHADYVVLSEGFNGLRRILRGEVSKGIVHIIQQEQFPVSEREQFYRDHKSHEESPIKSVITQTGCPYKCTYCYNSSTLDSIVDSVTSEQKEDMQKVLGISKTLFPKSQRPVDEILSEVEESQATAAIRTKEQALSLAKKIRDREVKK